MVIGEIKSVTNRSLLEVFTHVFSILFFLLTVLCIRLSTVQGSAVVFTMPHARSFDMPEALILVYV